MFPFMTTCRLRFELLACLVVVVKWCAVERRERDKTTGFATRNFGTKKDETKGSSMVK